MANYNITQLHRVVLRYKASAEAAWSTVVVDEDTLGQDSIATVNIAPRLTSRASQRGTTETPIAGTFDAFAGSITMLMDNFSILGKVLRRWNPATYDGAVAANGNMTDDPTNLCGDGTYVSVIVQGVCDDGSSADIELTRCMPSVDDDIEFGSSDTTEVTLNLHPIIYNASLHAEDGYPQKSYRFGDNDLTVKQRLNVTTGEYAAVNDEPATDGEG